MLLGENPMHTRSLPDISDMTTYLTSYMTALLITSAHLPTTVSSKYLVVCLLLLMADMVASVMLSSPRSLER